MSIQKLDFEKITREKVPFTMILTKVIQKIDDHFAGFIWVYLSSLPPDWDVNKQHLMNHFGIAEQKLKKHMAYLCKHKLIEYIRIRREDGTLGPVTINVLCGNDFESSTGMKIHPVEEPPGGKSSTYKENNINKENKDTNISESDDSRKTKPKKSKEYDIQPIIDIWNELAVPIGCPKQGREQKSLAEIKRNIKTINENWEHKLTPENFRDWLEVAIETKFYLITNPEYMTSLNVILRWQHFYGAYNKYINELNNPRR